jgi:outer membrane protein
MKYLLRKLVLATVLGAVLTGSAWAQTRIATVDLRKLFEGYWKTKQADAALKDRAAEYDKEYKGMRDDYQKTKDEYQKLLGEANDQAVSAEERERRKQAAETKLRGIKDQEETMVAFERQARTTLEEQKRRMRDKILDEIRAVIVARAKSAGYGLVLDTAAETPNATSVVVFSSGENDLTAAVLEQLNLNAPPDSSKPAEKKDEPQKNQNKK